MSAIIQISELALNCSFVQENSERVQDLLYLLRILMFFDRYRFLHNLSRLSETNVPCCTVGNGQRTSAG